MSDIDKIVPDGVGYMGHRYILMKKCKMVEIFPTVFSPKCNRDIVLNYKDTHWLFCPFCGGKLEQIGEKND